MTKLTVKRETIVRSMDKENFNVVIKDDTAVKILKINSYEIKDKNDSVVGVTNSFIVRLTNNGRSNIATLPGKVLFSSKVLNEAGEETVDATKDENFTAFYESVAEEGDEKEDINLADFENFVVIRTSPLIENRPAILQAQGTTNPNKYKFQLSDYKLFAEVLAANGNKYEGLDYDKIYGSGPKSPDATPLKSIFIKKV